ncbi:RNA-binding protein 7 [Phymastichus coffea]|uniref:RNA-binding protein 7 n=1 Tax=Phymastichus coffea TaxID=108790 RepID=UPI00273CA79C|nr:RNA-binding protein 7 [Phymastichus coffea]
MGDDDMRTIWCGGLHEKVTEDILYELFMQGGPVEKVSIPKDRDGKQKNFGFVTFKHLSSVPYVLDLFDGTSLFSRTLNMKSRNNSIENSNFNRQSQHSANLNFMYQTNAMEHKASKIQSEMELSQQILIGNMAPTAFAPNNVFMLPGMMNYPSQNSLQGSKNSSDYNRGNRYQNRNHPYRDRDYYDNRQHNRDNKPYNKHSSHRSYRHDNRRKYY